MPNDKMKIDDNSETIDVLAIDTTSETDWKPETGEEFLSLLQHLTIPEESKVNLSDETHHILRKSVAPVRETGGRTGLIVGYVQSGKTLSFTAVSALARDNNYPVLIVIAGTSILLSGQSVDRLREDLRIDGNQRTDRSWQQFTNPSDRSSADAIASAISNWKDSRVSKADRQSVLITVMKHWKHLEDLINILKTIDLNGVPVLIVDDEADQASLNAKARKPGEESTTYARIMELCRQIPHHTFLQYTATPQAPLLINIIDKLSPNFTQILTPGPGYAGGKQFFIEHPELVVVIPESENTDETTQEPPDSLIKALKIFFLGVASALSFDENQNRYNNRSMLIHPDFHTLPHDQFEQWIKLMKKRWEKTLEEDDQDRAELIEDFQEAYQELNKTVSNLPKFETLIEYLFRALSNTSVIKVNANNKDRRTPIIEWEKNYSYILIGGQAMDRGFTVAGLTVTYMSRGIGVGNADTLQQRARFFGYKQKYLGYCRVFLGQQMKNAFKEYVESEEDIRSQLKVYSDNGKPLSDWKRAFLMPDYLHPTRRNILVDAYTRDRLSDKWYSPRIPYGSEDSDQRNRDLVNEFIKKIDFAPNKGFESWPKHLVNDHITLQSIYNELLTQFLVTNESDSRQYTGLLLQLKNFLEQNPDETCSLYIMNRDSLREDWPIRTRSLDESGRIDELFQGRNPNDKSDRYPGDAKIGDRNRAIVQLYRLRLMDKPGPEGKVVVDDIRTLAVWVPSKMAKSWLVQDKGKKL